MKDKRLAYHTALTILFSILLCSCSHDDGYYDGPGIIQGNISEIALQQLNNGGAEPSVSSENRFPKEAYLLSIHVTTDSEAWSGYSYVRVDLTDPVTALRIFTVTDFSEEYPAGSDITSLFKEYPVYLRNNLHDCTPDGKDITQLDHNGGYFYKALLHYPNPGTYQFKVQMSFKSGKQITKETEEVEFY